MQVICHFFLKKRAFSKSIERAFLRLNRNPAYPIEIRLKADTVNPLLTLSNY
jgi:hypothetical protein